MNRRILTVGALCVLSFAGTEARAQELNAAVGEDLIKPTRAAVSTNKMQKIVVQGDDGKMRMAIASIAHEIATDLHTLLGEPEDFPGKRTILVEMYEKGQSKGNLHVRPRVSRFDENLIIELLVDTRTKVDRDILKRGVLEVLLYRRGLEGVSTLNADQEVRVPAWLSEGLIEALKWKKDSSKSLVYEQLLSHSELITIDKILGSTGRDVRGFDSTKRTFYRAASCAMVLSLLRQQDGKEAFSQFLSEVILFEGETEILLRKHFPDLSVGSKALQKMWSLQIAEMAAPKLIDAFTIEETDKRLSEMLFLSVPSEDGRTMLVPLDQYALLEPLNVGDRVLAITGVRQQIVHLSHRCHPVYRPVLFEYAKIALELGQGKVLDVDTRLANLADERQKMLVSDMRCRDYLDWYQISRAHKVVGDFSGYMRLRESLAMERESAKDASIDLYLDKVQMLMGTRDKSGLLK